MLMLPRINSGTSDYASDAYRLGFVSTPDVILYTAISLHESALVPLQGSQTMIS